MSVLKNQHHNRCKVEKKNPIQTILFFFLLAWKANMNTLPTGKLTDIAILGNS